MPESPREIASSLDARIDTSAGEGAHVSIDVHTPLERWRGARFVDGARRDELCRALEAARALVVRMTVGASARGRLGDTIDEAIERELDARGAAPPGIGATSDEGAALSDQLFRARRVGATGIALALGPLRAATSAQGAIEPEDGATLRFWTAATGDRPVWLLLDASDAVTGAYVEPIPLARVLASLAEPAEAIDESPGESGPIDEDDADDGDEPDAPIEVTPTEVIAVVMPIEAPAAKPSARVSIALAAPDTTPAPSPIQSAIATRIPVRLAASVPVEAPAPPPPPRVPSPDEWRPWALALADARGPQPLAAFERLFARDYLPLANAIAAGVDDVRAAQACDEFRRTFARAYADACPTFAVTGKRPRMVLDAADVAARIARLHGARTTQLLLVDAMRFDVGVLVRDAVTRALGSRASLTDEVLLWSALPTTTGRQLETLARGVDALRGAAADTDRDGDALRGRTADVIRRIRVGPRDLYKLDAVEARVRETGDGVLAALPAIANAAAEVIVRHAATLQPRTLLFFFGDHGFTMERDGTARQGGASPEEVLVPAFALLLGDLH